MIIESSFKAMLLERLEEVISSSKYPMFLYDIICKLQGASPIEIISLLTEYKIPYETDKRAKFISSADDRYSYAKKQVLSSIFATPHPADYDWRFDEKTVLFILYCVKNVLNTNDKIALLGAQTLFPIWKKFELDVLLFNKSASIIEDLKKAGFEEGLVEKDLFESLDVYHNIFKVVVSDPPWYLEHYQAFINRSSEILQVNGYLFISVLPKLTRPSAVEDRVKIREIAESSGFEFVRSDDTSLFYDTPWFEDQSLIANGIYCDNWRTGDLWVFRKVKDVSFYNYIIDHIVDPVWLEYRIGEKRIKLREKDTIEGDMFTFECADGDSKILSNVSRRYEARNRVDVWNSDNVAFKLTRPSLLKECLSILENSNIDSVKKYLSENESVSLREYEDILALIREII